MRRCSPAGRYARPLGYGAGPPPQQPQQQQQGGYGRGAGPQQQQGGYGPTGGAAKPLPRCFWCQRENCTVYTCTKNEECITKARAKRARGR